MVRLIGVGILLACLVFAQTNTGTITGSVLDPQRALVPGATVTATNLATNVPRVARSSSAGAYSLPALSPGSYRITVEAAGFAKLVQEPVVVATSTTVTLDLTLTVGQTTTEVTVTGEAQLLQQSNAVIQYTVTELTIAALPFGNQNAMDSLVTLPGVVGPSGWALGFTGTEQSEWNTNVVTPGAGVSISGGRQGSTQYKADGIDNTSLYFGRIGITFSADAVAEVSVQANSFSSEFGRTGGGIVNMTTKSGTNQFHGTLFSFIQNDKMNAARYVRSKGKDPLRMWRGGADVGGPVYLPKLYDGRNRTFFFAGYEPLRQSTGFMWPQRVPTALERKGDFSQSLYDSGPNNYPVTIFRQFEFNSSGTALTNKRIVPAAGTPFPQWPGNIIPSQFLSPIALKLMQFFPLPNMPLSAAAFNWQGNQSVKNTDNRWLAKIDQVVSNANRLSVRFATAPTTGFRWLYGRNDPADTVPTDRNRSSNIVVADTHIWGGDKVNEFHSGFSRTFTNRSGSDLSISKNWFQEYGIPSNLNYGFPRMGGLGTGTDIWEIDNNVQLNDFFNWMKGIHSLKFGFEFQAPQQNSTDKGALKGNWGFSTSMTNIGTGVNTATYPGIGRPSANTGFAFASFLLGFPDSVSIAANAIPYQYRWKYYAGFLNDEMKLAPRLTLNVGLRYQVEVPRSEKHHNQGTYVGVPATTSDGIPVVGAVQLSGLGGAPNTLFPTRYNNFEPRAGIAYRLPTFLPWLRVLRAGYSLSHVPTSSLFNVTAAMPNLNPRSSSLASQGGQDGGWVNIDWNTIVLPKPLPAWPKNGLFADLSKISSVAVLSKHVTIPYTQQWNVGLGFQFTPTLGGEASYVGSRGTQLFGQMGRSNLQDLSQYQAAFLQGVDMTRQVPNPYGAKDINGAVANISYGDQMRANPLVTAISNPLVQGYNSSYHALQLKLDKRYSDGLQFTVGYTFSKLLDDSSCEGVFCSQNVSWFGRGFPQSYNSRAGEWSYAVNDIPHALTYSFAYHLPFGRGQLLAGRVNRVIDQVIGHWELGGVGTVRSGQPWQDYQGNSANAGWPTDYGLIRPNIVPGVPFQNPIWAGNNGTGAVVPYLNFAAFSPAARFSFGNAPRTMGYARYPTAKTIDLSILKEFPIHEQMRLEFRCEAYSAFNHVNFNGSNDYFYLYNSLDYKNYAVPPATNVQPLYSATYNNTNNNRVIQLGLKLYF